MTQNIPDLPVSPLVEQDGFATAPEYQFRQNLIQALQSVTSNEGLVPPTQTTANIAKIAAGRDTEGNFSCQRGTLIYNSDTDELMACYYVAGVPTFKNLLHA
jgi:hypothetical protein